MSAIDLDVDGTIVGIQGVLQPSGVVSITYLVRAEVGDHAEFHVVHEGAIREVVHDQR